MTEALDAETEKSRLALALKVQAFLERPIEQLTETPLERWVWLFTSMLALEIPLELVWAHQPSLKEKLMSLKAELLRAGARTPDAEAFTRLLDQADGKRPAPKIAVASPSSSFSTLLREKLKRPK